MASLAPKVCFWSCMACAQVLDSLLMPLTCPTVTGGLAAGTYKLCSINSAAVRLGRAYLLLSKGITDKTSPLTEPPAGARRCRSARLARRSVSCRHFRGPKLVLTSSFPSDQTAFTSPPVLEAMLPTDAGAAETRAAGAQPAQRARSHRRRLPVKRAGRHV